MQPARIIAVIAATLMVLPPAVRGQTAAAYARDIELIMDRSHVWANVERTRAPPAMSPLERAYYESFVKQITRQAIFQRLRPVFERALSAPQAASVVRLLETPVFRKRQERALVAPDTVSYGSSFFTPEEAAQLRHLDASQAALDMKTARSVIDAEMGKVMRAWYGQYCDELERKTWQILVRLNADLSARNDGKIQNVTIGRLGMDLPDRVIQVVGHSMIQMDEAIMRLDAEVERLNLGGAMDNQKLVSKTGLAGSRQAVEGVEAALEIMLKQLAVSLEQREQRLRDLGLGQYKADRKIFEKALEDAHAESLDFGEAFRRVLDQQRRVLAFMEARLGRVSLENGELVFSSEEEAKLADGLFENMSAAAKELERITEAQARKEEERFNQGKGAAALPKPG